MSAAVPTRLPLGGAALGPAAPSALSTSIVTLALCYVVGMFEGFDNQVAGVAAPHMHAAFAMTPGQLGWFFSISTIGMMFGAAVGGRLSDHFGRKPALIVSVTVFGAMSLCTAWAPNFAALMSFRFLTGLGLGGALPNLIALIAETAAPRWRIGLLSALYASMPGGGAVVSIMGARERVDWQVLFQTGGCGPLVLALVMIFLLPEPSLEAGRSRAESAPPPSVATALLGEGRGVRTLLLCCAFLLACLTLSVMVNWLPTLLVSRGLSRADASVSQISFSLLGAGVGIVTALLMDRFERRSVVAGAFAFSVLALLVLAVAPVGPLISPLVAGMVGAAMAMSQGLLYGLAPAGYPARIRGTGVGAGVGAGRIGSAAGPLLAGILLASAASPQRVLGVLIPVIAVAGLAAFTLAIKTRAVED